MGVSSSSITDSPQLGLSTLDLAAVSSGCCTESAPGASVPASPLVTDDLSVQETPQTSHTVVLPSTSCDNCASTSRKKRTLQRKYNQLKVRFAKLEEQMKEFENVKISFAEIGIFDESLFTHFASLAYISINGKVSYR